MLSVCHQVVRAAGYSLLLFLQLAAAVTAAAFCINDAIGPFGSQSFFWPYVTSTANTRTLLFEYNGVCRRASAYSSSECYPYDASPGPIVADNEYLNWYRQQLASFDGGLAMAGTVLAAMGCLIVPLTLHRAVTMVYCGGPEATRWFYNWTSRALLGVALAQLLGTLLVFAAFFRLRSVMAFEHYQSEGPDKHTPSQKSYPPWSIPGHGYSDDLPQGEDFTTLSVPYIASQLPIAAAAAPAALVMNTIVVLCMTSFLVCNLRHGRAAKAFAVWGRVVAILLGLACVGSLIANVAGYDAKQSMCRGYFEAAGATAELRWCWVGELGWDSGSFDPITLPQLLRKLINPISLPYTFVPEFASVQSNIPLIFNDECLVVSAIQLVLFVPVAVVAFLATSFSC
ncbi:hypothetical protein FNF29_07105 [Cafeteria roenbergensis]|uniref:Uncharacterized protein n=1 Tax=Cafeteria roenbergensis TaxID=33653 RepID=A0A5A8C6P8_CAFRO|nr:hypothetical protein FNF29_07105 [Cafeteria roenbergensis]|eukprot:KAA0147760.1 hypothetical protein FNF29_07105 [Cafeteria roenbergensis]